MRYYHSITIKYHCQVGVIHKLAKFYTKHYNQIIKGGLGIMKKPGCLSLVAILF
jgi:hypothetical protein